MSQTKDVLIVGVGSIGLRHLRCFQSTGRARLSFCEVNRDLRAKVAKDCNVDRHYPDLESALADRFDAAVICTPANLHIPMATCSSICRIRADGTPSRGSTNWSAISGCRWCRFPAPAWASSSADTRASSEP